MFEVTVPAQRLTGSPTYLEEWTEMSPKMKNPRLEPLSVSWATTPARPKPVAARCPGQQQRGKEASSSASWGEAVLCSGNEAMFKLRLCESQKMIKARPDSLPPKFSKM